MNVPDFITQDADGHVRLTGHRIGIHDVVYFYHEGYSPEMLLAEFPTLSLALIHNVLAFYWENQAEIDAYLAQCETEIERQRATARSGPSLVQLRRGLRSLQEAQVQNQEHQA